MKTSYVASTVLSLVNLAAGYTVAGDDPAQGKTREQVRAEFLEAQRTGDIMDYTFDKKLNELYPGRYPAKAAVQGKTREQVRAEFLDAQRTGDIMNYVFDMKLSELYPSRYPVKAAVQGKAYGE